VRTENVETTDGVVSRNRYLGVGGRSVSVIITTKQEIASVEMSGRLKKVCACFDEVYLT